MIAEHTAGDDASIHLLRETLLAFDEALHYQTPAEWKQDFGYEGILQMLDRAKAMLQRACANIDMDFAASENPYAYFESSPYQLVVGSYLAANGVYLNSWQLFAGASAAHRGADLPHSCRHEAVNRVNCDEIVG